MVSAERVRVDQKKIETIVEWRSPRSVIEVQIFLGHTWYYSRFVKGFATIEAPLTKYNGGVQEDVLVKVRSFIIPINFLVLDFEEDRGISILLGRPFLAIFRSTIDLEKN
ncbi:RNA-directed DNA polymerase-like protein [Gossypium australe]|uniref:RNA-directed DNA polymerase-like protein n=1 Tax=Gossypium australe TaxID=47621 RepID=A0A5B6WQM6_9ROSI|nr:RNA-directed DNA polymerase-like protein [Gossypium australe]